MIDQLTTNIPDTMKSILYSLFIFFVLTYSKYFTK